jgi:biopolymer transport protein TolR
MPVGGKNGNGSLGRRNGNGRGAANGNGRKHHHRIHERRSGTIKPPQTKSEINVTPLVDVVLVLLIIFMVVTPLLHRGVHVALPTTEHHNKKQDTGEQIMLSVRKDGTYIDADRVDSDALSSVLQRELRKGNRPVNVRADRSLRYGDVRKVIEQVHAAGAGMVNVETTDRKE